MIIFMRDFAAVKVENQNNNCMSARNDRYRQQDTIVLWLHGHDIEVLRKIKLFYTIFNVSIVNQRF